MQDDEFDLEELKTVRATLGEELSKLDEVIANLEFVLTPVPHSDDHDFLVAIRRSYLWDLIRTRRAINDNAKRLSGGVTATILAVKRKYPKYPPSGG